MAEKDPPAQKPACGLCKGQHHQLSSYTQWKNEAAQKYVHDHGLSQDELVCNACRKDVTKITSNNTFIPR